MGWQGVPNSEGRRIPPISDPSLRPPNPHDNIAGAGAAALSAPANAGTSPADQAGLHDTQTFDEGRQVLFPPTSVGGKVSAEVKRLGTTNNPGYSEIPIGQNAQRVRKLGLEPSKIRHRAILDQFDDALNEFERLTSQRPLDEGSGVAVIDQYTCLQSLVKGVVYSANDLMDALENAGAIHEMEEVRKEVIERQEEMKRRYNRSGVDHLIQIWNRKKNQSDSEASQSHGGGSQASLTSVQIRRGALAAKRVSVQSKDKIAAEELRMQKEEHQAEVQRKENQRQLDRLRERSELDEMEAREKAYEESSAQGDIFSSNETQPPPQSNLPDPTHQQPPPSSVAPPQQGGSGGVRFTTPSGRVLPPGSTDEMVDDTLEKIIRGNGHPGSNTAPPPTSTTIPTSTKARGNTSNTSQPSPGTTHSNPSATQSSGFATQETVIPGLSSQSTNPSEGKFLDKMSALVDTMVSLQTTRNDESSVSEVSGPSLAANRQLAWSIMKADTEAEKFDGEDATAYHRWRKSMEMGAKELELPPEKRLELLTLRTTNYAAEIVRSASDLTIESPEEALKIIWDHFEGRFKRNPQAANHLLDKLQKFPSVSVKDAQNLWRFSFACQQAATLMDTDLGRSLCVLDFPEMQRKVVGRLDASLQSKWGNQVFKAYEDESQVPFKDFSLWVKKLAERHSNPYLKFGGEPSLPKPIDHYYESSSSRTHQPPPVEFNPLASSTRTSTQERTGSACKPNSAGRDPKERTFHTSDRQEDAENELCPLSEHANANHSFWNCYTFRGWTYARQRAFLRDDGRCIACLGLSHSARSQHCRHPSGICKECEMMHHPQLKCPNSEEKKQALSVACGFSRSIFDSRRQCLTSRATKGSTYGPTVPVIITHPSCAGRTVHGLALIDNQSTSTWIDRKVEASLRIDRKSIGHENFELTTMECANAKHKCRVISGLQIAPCHDNPEADPQFRDLPVCAEGNVPAVSDELASMEEVKEMAPHLAKHHTNFPRKRTAWKTIILLGRDCGWAMQQETVNVPDEDNGLIVSRTPLGWTLIGPKPVMKRNSSQSFPENKGQAVRYTDSKRERRSLCEEHAAWRTMCEKNLWYGEYGLDYLERKRDCSSCHLPSQPTQPGSIQSSRGRQRSDRRRTLMSVTCYGCGELGHYARIVNVTVLLVPKDESRN